MNKYLLLALKIIAVIAVIFLLGFSIKTWFDLQEAKNSLETTTMLLSGEKNILQKKNDELGLAETTIVEKNTLIADYEKTTKNLKKEINDLKSKIKVTPISKDTVVVIVDNTIKGGDQTTSDTNGKISYDWKSADNRFHLVDPDISLSGNEQFNYKLKIKVTGYVLSDKSGNFQARQVIAQEILPSGELGAPLDVENNIYQYSVKTKETSVFDILHPKLYALLDTDLDPGIGLEVLNLGHWIPYANIGIGPFVAANINEVPTSLKSSKVGLGVQYTLVPPLLSTNIGIGLGVSTPTDNLFGEYQVSGNLLFFLTN